MQSKENLVHLQVWRFKSWGFEIDSHQFYAYFETLGRKRNTLNKFDITHFVFLSEKNKQRARELNAGNDISQEAFYLKFLKDDETNLKILLFKFLNMKQVLNYVRILWIKVMEFSIPHANVTFRREGIEWFKQALPYYIEHGWVVFF